MKNNLYFPLSVGQHSCGSVLTRSCSEPEKGEAGKSILGALYKQGSTCSCSYADISNLPALLNLDLDAKGFMK